MNKIVVIAGLALSFIGGISTPLILTGENIAPQWKQCGTAESDTNMQVRKTM